MRKEKLGIVKESGKGRLVEDTFGIPNEVEPLFDERKCRVCGCTDDNACPGGCYWVEEDLCSQCVEIGEKQ